jgi:signal transduction histidine kinase/DNA-binding response OmpR family regulator
MGNAGELARENEALRQRLSRLSEASLRINESLDFETVLQGVLDSARALSDSRYGVITLLDDQGRIRDFVYSGLTPEESRQFAELPDGMAFFEYLSNIREPLRLQDFHSYTRSLGLPEFRPPFPVSSPLPFLAAPIRHRDEAIGAIYVGEKEQEFTAEDEETLVMFASQAALVIANARRHREEQRTRADLETLVNTTPVGVMVFDAGTGEVRSINREARRIVSDLCAPGGSAEQLLEVLTFRRADGREVSLEEFPLAQALSTGETVRAEEIVIGVPDGRSVSVLLNATAIRSEEGQVESVVVTLQDMTALEELDRLRAEFLGMVSHELRAPLTSIKGSAATVLGSSADLDPAVVRQFFRIIEDQADHMHDLVADLLDVARIETGTLPVTPEPAEVAVLVDRARSTFTSAGGRNNLAIDIPPDLPLVMADRRRIVQVVGNLLSNAAKHSSESSVITVTVVREDVHVAVSVADEGRGIPSERLPYLFRKFTRTDGDDLGSGVAGSGLGLAICKGIVEAHGGRIWAESDGPGLGARFTFTMPAADGDGGAGLAAPASTYGGSRRGARDKLRILAVDDDPQALRYVRDALTKAGYVPIVTGDPEDVPRLMEEEKPHLVLLDLMLPGSDGIELMNRILKTADVPVIFVSVYGQDDIIVRAFDMGAADYVVKPFSPTELAARIRAALRKRAAPELAEPSRPYVRGDLTVDYPQRRVTVAGRTVALTIIEYRMLVELSVNAGRALTHERLLQRVWGPDKGEDSGPVRNIVRRLRRKLGDDPDDPTYIFALPTVGYRMAEAETQEGGP